MEILVDESSDSKLWQGYIYGILEQEINPFIVSEYFEEGDDMLANGMCLQNFEAVRRTINLGSEIEKVRYTDYGFDVLFHYGDNCDIFGKERFSSSIKFICDPSEGDGWPKMIPEDGDNQCHRAFEWRTASVCKQCTNKDVKLVHEECGVREADQ